MPIGSWTTTLGADAEGRAVADPLVFEHWPTMRATIETTTGRKTEAMMGCFIRDILVALSG